ncbi:unnamed protein product [Cylicocyclus nassatus]|uniref:Uncharacterized protein n=1 Tax=Cylicocyclus nassatus TaxID=53992 RepID=A0AA36H1X1_CYLNA|nr:unnamed protein product [Cylicocyclus nassatus]
MAEQEPAEAAKRRKDSILCSLVPQRCHHHFLTNNFRVNPFVLIKKHMFIFKKFFSEPSTDAVAGYSLSFAVNLSIRRLRPGEDRAFAGTSTLGAGTSNCRSEDVARLEDEIRDLEQRYRSKVDELSRLR